MIVINILMLSVKANTIVNSAIVSVSKTSGFGPLKLHIQICCIFCIWKSMQTGLLIFFLMIRSGLLLLLFISIFNIRYYRLQKYVHRIMLMFSAQCNLQNKSLRLRERNQHRTS